MSHLNVLKHMIILPKLRTAFFNKNYVLHRSVCQHLRNAEKTNRYVILSNKELSRFICSFRFLSKSADDPDTEKDSTKKKDGEKALDDKEFRGILQDFSKDFEVGNETKQILKDIKKKLEKSSDESNQGIEKLSISKPDTDESELPHKKFKEFIDKDATIIYSYEEEQLGLYDQNEATYHINQEEEMQYEWKTAKRGISGVFDIDELVKVLDKENVFDITVIKIPEYISYADFMVLTTAKSKRHCNAVAEFIIKLYKAKKGVRDPFVQVEGSKDSTWNAIDMGNIVLHIFLKDTRAMYDIESLWVFDREFDSGGFAPKDPMLESIEEQLAFFNEMDVSQVTALSTTKKNA